MRRIVLALSFFILLVLGLNIAPVMSQAQSQTQPASTLTTEASRMDRMAGTLGETKVVNKLSTDFSSFLGAGSPAIVTGLRNGTPITLATTTLGPTPSSLPVTTTTTITPPTGKMGFGNVFISLALAKYQLSQMGITQPTPTQLQAALLGGTITTGTGATATSSTLQGILTMRSQDMGWGQIAQRLGVNLGPGLSSLKTANHGLATTGAVAPTGSGVVNAGGQPTGSSESGVVSGSGKSVGKSGKETSGKSDGGEGIVTGSGRPAGSPSGITTGRGHGYGVSGGGPGSGGQGKGSNK